ncbi:MAG: tetratricopeptide repeat protein [Ignavibacteriales bacterium]|nr:tetratricopeptide repeat protein [Ignavibacteriales bacterium]
MKHLLYIAAIALIAAACSSNVVKEEETKPEDTGIVLDARKVAQDKFIKGSVFEAKGEIPEAIANYQEALSLDPQPGIYYALAKNYYLINKLSPALDCAQKATQSEPQNKEYLYLLASVYNASRLEDSSAAVYEKIIKLDSTDATSYFQLALLNEKSKPLYSISLYKKVIDLIGPEWNVLIRLIDVNERLGNVNETINTVEELLKLNPSDLRLQKVLIESYLKTNSGDRALKLIDEALTSFPGDIELIEMKAKAWISKDEYKKAFEEYKKLLAREEIGFENKMQIGGIFLSASEKDSTNLIYAKEIFNELNKDSLDWQVNAYLGEIELRLKNDSSAVKYFTKAAEAAEWNAQIWIRLGGLLFDKRKYSEAVQLMSKAVEKFPNDFAINLIYGLSLSQENDHASAKIYLQKAQRVNPSDLTALTALGFTLNQLEEYDEALKYLNQALAINPNDVQTIGMTALIYDSKENFKMSDSLYGEAMKLDSSNALILNNYAYSLAERRERLEDALRMSKKAVEQEPNSASYLDTYGWIFYQLGDYKKAKEYIEKALLLEDKNATLAEHLGDIYFKLGDKEKAMRHWEKALANDLDNEKLKTKIAKGEL